MTPTDHAAMPPTDRTSFLAARKLGVGGSDCASLFNIGYGCRRRLWYDKTGTPEDFPREDTNATRLGTLLEPFFADQYAERTGRTLGMSLPRQHPDIPEARVNPDRVIYVEGMECGILEIKSCSRGVYYTIKREGLPEDYILQLQQAMMVTGSSWGSFAIGNRDNGDMLWWDVDADRELGAKILAEVQTFWATVENGPMPDALDPDDRRCQSCSWRSTCQGNALIQIERNDEMPQMETLRPLLAEYDARVVLLDEATDLLDATKAELKSELGDTQAAKVGDRKVYFRPQDGRVLYKGKELLEAYRSVRTDATGRLLVELPSADAFVEKSKPSRPLRIY